MDCMERSPRLVLDRIETSDGHDGKEGRLAWCVLSRGLMWPMHEKKKVNRFGGNKAVVWCGKRGCGLVTGDQGNVSWSGVN